MEAKGFCNLNIANGNIPSKSSEIEIVDEMEVGQQQEVNEKCESLGFFHKHNSHRSIVRSFSILDGDDDRNKGKHMVDQTLYVSLKPHKMEVKDRLLYTTNVSMERKVSNHVDVDLCMDL